MARQAHKCVARERLAKVVDDAFESGYRTGPVFAKLEAGDFLLHTIECTGSGGIANARFARAATRFV